MKGVSPSVAMTVKFVVVYKKDSKLDYRTMAQSPFYQMLKKILYKRMHALLNNNNIIYNLNFGFRQQYSTYHALFNIAEKLIRPLDDININ